MPELHHRQSPWKLQPCQFEFRTKHPLHLAFHPPKIDVKSIKRQVVMENPLSKLLDTFLHHFTMVPSIIVGDKEGIFTSVPGVEPPEGKVVSETSGCPVESEIFYQDLKTFFQRKKIILQLHLRPIRLALRQQLANLRLLQPEQQ